MSYKAGDYLAVLPLNPKETIARAMRYFGLAWDSVLTISSTSPSSLPTDHPIPAADLLGAYVELAQPATRRNIVTLSSYTTSDDTKAELTRLAGDAFTSEISQKRISILNLLETHKPTLTVPLSTFLTLLPPMRVRQYSISSSPLWNPSHTTLTFAVLDAPSFSGTGRHLGVASSYLSSLAPGDKLHVAVRPSHQAFHLPADASNVPVLMVAAGSGLAPFRGFVQERAAQIGAGRDLAPAILFFGCRSPADDDLYAEELAKWEAAGAVSVRRAYSRCPEESQGCKYVQERFWGDRKDVMELWGKGAKVFVCGSREVGEAVKEASIRIMKESVREKEGREVDDEKAEAWFEKIRNERYATDVFA